MLNPDDDGIPGPSRTLPGWPTEYEWPLARERFEIREDREFFQSYFGAGWYSALMDWERPIPLLHREKLLDDLRLFLGGARAGNTPPNIILSGGPGTCKSAAVDAVLSELTRSHSPGFFVGFVRFVWNKVRRFDSVVEPIRLQFEMKMRTGQLLGWPPTALPYVGGSTIAHAPRNLIAVIEEADEGPRGELVSDIGELNRMREWDEAIRVSTVVLCRSRETCRVPFVTNTPRGVWARLEAPPYTLEQLRHILRARVERAFPVGTVTADSISKCADVVYRTTRDPRDMFRLVLEAAELAVDQQASQITLDRFEEAIWREPWRWDGR